MIPQRLKRPKMGLRESTVIRCPGHLKFVRGFSCAIADKWSMQPNLTNSRHVCFGKIEAHHCREGSNGGTGMKPDDSTAVPLCAGAHATGHTVGWQTFEGTWGVDLSKIAAELWARSPHRISYERHHTPAAAE